MTVANQSNRTSAMGSGSTGQEIAFSFPISDTSDLTCYQRVTATGVQTTLAETTNYTVTISGDTGGTITTVTAIATTAQFHAVRTTPYTQSLDLEAGGTFNAENIEDALDKNTKLSIQQKDRSDRSLRFPETDPTSSIGDIPSSIDRVSKTAGYDSAGKPNASVEVASGSVSFTTIGTNIAEATDADAVMVLINGISVFNVTNAAYGADGDGTDDTIAIQAAITAAGVLGGIVWFPTPSSKYGISTALSVPDNVWLMSQYAEIELLASSDDHVIENSDPTGGNSNIRIVNLHIDGNGANQGGGTYHGIHMDNVTNLKILDCFIEDADHTNIRLDNCTSFKIKGNRSTIADLHGIGADTCTIGVIEKNESYSNGEQGIHVLDSSAKINISNNITHDNGTAVTHHGIYVLETSNYTVSNNISYDNAGDGIMSRECTDGTCTGNNCYSNGRTGLSFRQTDTDASRAVMTGNSCRGNTEHGIQFSGNSGFITEFGTISGNYCGGNSDRGINLQYATQCSITGNVCENNGDEGIRLINNCDENIVANNVVKDCSQDGSGLFAGILIHETSKRNIITNNFIRGSNHLYGIFEAGFSDENRIVDNVILDAITSPYSTVGANTVVETERTDRVLSYENETVFYENEVLVY